MDTVYFSCDLPLSDAMRERLAQEKTVAQARAAQRQVHCPEWLEARVCPQGAKGGYAFLIETEGFSVKLLGDHILNRPSMFIEMRSHALHTHPEGAAGACEAALAWVRAKVYADQFTAAKNAISFAAKISRADIHIDWHGGYTPALSNLSEDLRCFIRPGRVKGALYFHGGAATGIQFGRSQVVARLYNKTLETKEKGNEAYAELLTARCGDAFDPNLDMWRLEFEIKREGARGFRLYASPEEEDPDEEVEAEMSAEELQHIGTLPRFFARMEELFHHLMRHWLRLVEESEDANRSRWPMHSTWQQLREAFGSLAGVPPLDDEKRRLVRGARYRGRMRLLRRMEAGVIRSLEVEDASPTSTALMTLKRWMERIAEKEVERITAKCQRYQEQGKSVPAWVQAGMDERFRRVEQVEQRVQMLLGIFALHGVLPLEFKPAYAMDDPLVQHLATLEQEAEEKRWRAAGAHEGFRQGVLRHHAVDRVQQHSRTPHKHAPPPSSRRSRRQDSDIQGVQVCCQPNLLAHSGNDSFTGEGGVHCPLQASDW
jgi:hypothetical protein